MKLYRFPEQTKVDRVIPKNKFYQQGHANSKMEKRFVESVDKIIWANKLSPDTIHLSASDTLKEIQIFRIKSRKKDFDPAILSFIDKLILIPIIFEIHFEGKVKVMATYKRLNQANKNKVVIGQYYQSDWLEETYAEDLPIFLNLSDLYEHFIELLLPRHNEIDESPVSSQLTYNEKHQIAAPDERLEDAMSIEDKIALSQEIDTIQKQIDKLNSRLKKEKQFNRKVEINLQSQKLQANLNNLLNSQS